VIKSALINSLNAIDDPKMQEHLKIAYINLSQWQEGVGENDQGLDLSKIDPNQSAEEIAHAMVDQSPGDKDWGTIILNEQRELRQELEHLGFSNKKL